MIVLILIGLIAPQEPDVEALLKQLADESIEVREKAAAALVSLGDKAEERLKKASGSAEGELKGRLDSILKTIDDRRKLRTVLPPVRRITMEGKSRPLKDVIREFELNSGHAVKIETGAEGPVTVAISDATPLQALDAICKAAGVGYTCVSKGEFDPVEQDYPEIPPVLRVGGTYRDFPKAFAGHFAIFASTLSINATTDFESTSRAALLQLALFWPVEVRPVETSVEIATAVDDKGRSVKWEDKHGPSYSLSTGGNRREAPNRELTQVWLKGPESNAAKISLQGKLKATYVVERKFVTFEKPGDPAEQSKEFDGVRFVLKEFKQEKNEVEFTIEVTGERRRANTDSNRWRIGGSSFDASLVTIKTDKAPSIGYGGYSGSGDGKKQTYRMNFSQAGDGPVIAVQIEVDGLAVEDTVEFELKDILLPK